MPASDEIGEQTGAEPLTQARERACAQIREELRDLGADELALPALERRVELRLGLRSDEPGSASVANDRALAGDMTIRDLAADLRNKHPMLFRPRAMAEVPALEQGTAAALLADTDVPTSSSREPRPKQDWLKIKNTDENPVGEARLRNEPVISKWAAAAGQSNFLTRSARSVLIPSSIESAQPALIPEDGDGPDLRALPSFKPEIAKKNAADEYAATPAVAPEPRGFSGVLASTPRAVPGTRARSVEPSVAAGAGFTETKSTTLSEQEIGTTEGNSQKLLIASSRPQYTAVQERGWQSYAIAAGLGCIMVVGAFALIDAWRPADHGNGPGHQQAPVGSQSPSNSSAESPARNETPQVPHREAAHTAELPMLEPEATKSVPLDEVRGPPEVIDAATMRVGGEIVRLVGVTSARGANVGQLTEYLNGRSVSCTAVAAGRYRCLVDGRDLSKVVLYNGGGRADANASPELRAAERHARTRKLGVWKR